MLQHGASWTATDQNQLHPALPRPRPAQRSDPALEALKKRGFRFVGTTICYAFMQAAGLVNDHVTDCFATRRLAARYHRRLCNTRILGDLDRPDRNRR